MKKIILIVILFISINAFSQTIYYVDATGGNDANSGTSPVQAWKTIDKVNDQTFTAGNIILFKRGETWTEQLEVSGSSGTETSLITFGAYPQTGGAKPIITNIVNQAITWTNQSGNLWKADNPPAETPERLWLDNVELLRADTITEFDGVNFLWFYDSNGDLFLYSNTDPTSRQVSFTNGKVDVYVEDANYIVFTNLDLRGGWTSVYVNSNTSYIHFTDMEIGRDASNGININSENSSIPNHIHIKNCNFDANFTLDYSMAGHFKGTDDRGCSDAIFIQEGQYCEIDNNYFKNWGHASIDLGGDADVDIAYISIHHNYLTAPDICYGGRIGIDDAHNCEVFDNQIIRTTVQCQFGGYNNHIHHNIIDSLTNPPIIDNSDEISAGISLESYSHTEVYNNIIENNLIKNTEGAGLRFTNAGYFDIHDNIIRNNIFYNCGTVDDENGIGIKVDSNTAECEMRANLFYNNLIFNENTTNTIDFQGTVTDVAGFNLIVDSNSSQMDSNIAFNPLFVDIVNSDFHLSANSPCIDAGTNTLATLDFDGNVIPCNGTSTDIGIYEYQDANSINNCVVFDDIRIYPNPTKSYIKISIYNSVGVDDISIYNEAGQQVISGIVSGKNVDISALTLGIYFVKIVTSNGVTVKKIIKVD